MDELSWSDLLLGLILYAAIHAIVSDLCGRATAKLFGDDDDSHGELAREVESYKDALLKMAEALEALRKLQEDQVTQFVEALKAPPPPPDTPKQKKSK